MGVCPSCDIALIIVYSKATPEWKSHSGAAFSMNIPTIDLKWVEMCR